MRREHALGQVQGRKEAGRTAALASVSSRASTGGSSRPPVHHSPRPPLPSLPSNDARRPARDRDPAPSHVVETQSVRPGHAGGLRRVGACDRLSLRARLAPATSLRALLPAGLWPTSPSAPELTINSSPRASLFLPDRSTAYRRRSCSRSIRPASASSRTPSPFTSPPGRLAGRRPPLLHPRPTMPPSQESRATRRSSTLSCRRRRASTRAR